MNNEMFSTNLNTSEFYRFKQICLRTLQMEAVLPGPIDWRPTPTQTLTPKNMTCRHFIIISKRPIAAQQWQNQNPITQNCRHIHLKQCTMIKSLSPCYMQIFFLYTFKYLDIKCPWFKNLHIVFTWENWYEQDGDYISSGYSVVIVLTPKDL